ncbi:MULTISPECIES: hypothetical protein [Bacillus]|uniref:Uncharacterized protein n=1 Tax=Bacillus glycinifermentans TaxID=1664069 RepID=A0A0J6EG21_9BACI|nr:MULTISPECIES: hypothetical protein [Bacillus]ATH93318.1 hypothetical protein COP00_12450 [Bacillus glycinifermentans]KRT88304.1 hypothetical protein AB447_207840 [Bacillus glycinifermentans]KRT90702.1 hypothetical protein AB447_224145 [Bacillus glycinifermentans]MDU0071737.1 hypothetical protein [Bacillus sp. IG6]MEC0483388.1 hypothetical protein [Bacillus glycinifermentans]
MTLYVKRLWSDTPPLRPQQAEQLLDLYERPIATFKDAGRAYQIGFNTALTCLGYLIATKHGGNDDE